MRRSVMALGLAGLGLGAMGMQAGQQSMLGSTTPPKDCFDIKYLDEWPCCDGVCDFIYGGCSGYYQERVYGPEHQTHVTSSISEAFTIDCSIWHADDNCEPVGTPIETISIDVVIETGNYDCASS